jgi:hypothetical protein
MSRFKLYWGVAAILLAAVGLSSCKGSTKPMGGSGELNGTLSAGGGQYAHTFTTAGSFNYHCTIHPGCAGLAGTIVVVPQGGVIQNRVLAITQSGGSSGLYGSTCSALSLQRDSVFVGDQVTWTNSSPFEHTVTSQ